VMIEQDGGCGEVDRICLHSLHVRHLASELGLLKGDADAWTRVRTLERRLLILRDRIEQLDNMLWSVPCMPPGSGPTSDCVYSDSTLIIADEFCADLPNSPESGCIDEPNDPGSGDVRQGKGPNKGGVSCAQGDLLEQAQ
jgi:hypothetical protein